MANIIIVGAGVAGLTAGIYAQMHGHHATIYERHSKAGGNLTGWDRHGYHIDNCIHWLTGTNPVTDFYQMWVDLGVLGEGIEVHQPENLYTYQDSQGRQLSLNKSTDQLKRDMLRASPEDKREILGLIHAMRSVQKLQDMGGKDCNRRSNALEKLFSAPDLVKYYKYSIGDLAKRFKSPLISEFLLSFMPEQFSALALIMVFSTFTGKNGGIPKGVSCAMADRMVERFLSLGGELHLKNGVQKIPAMDESSWEDELRFNRGFDKKKIPEQRVEWVTLDDGTDVFADYVIVTPDPLIVFTKLMRPVRMPEKLFAQYSDRDMIRYSATHCAFAYDGEDVGFTGDMVFEVPEQYRELLCSKYLMMREFSHEKSFAPAGKSIIQTMAYCLSNDANSLMELYRDKAAYDEYKQSMARAVEEIICERMPALKGKITCIDTWTPATYHRFVGSDIGAFMSFIMPAGAVPSMLSGEIEGVENVVLATQWQMAPGGLPIAATAGINAIKLIDKKEKKK